MPEYPDNSHSARENTSPPSKRVEKVVNGTAKTRKQSEVKKFAGIFMPDEVGDVKTFIITDVVISMLDYVLDTKRKRHITGGLLLSGALLFGGLAMTVMSIRDDEEDEDE